MSHNLVNLAYFDAAKWQTMALPLASAARLSAILLWSPRSTRQFSALRQFICCSLSPPIRAGAASFGS
jgi:hypothetical protein